jgi:AcrR family transcriptional regulator
MSSPGLRERKKQKTRWAIQEHAMRLFAQQGYDETTVEQIAAAAEVSPSTFFRYFKTKEDVVVQDRYDDMIVEAIKVAPDGLTPVQIVRHSFQTVFRDVYPADIESGFARGKLTLENPAVRSRSFQNMLATIDVMAVALAERLGREPSDGRVRALCGACIGALMDCVLRWLDGGAQLEALADLVDEALDVVENGV